MKSVVVSRADALVRSVFALCAVHLVTASPAFARYTGHTGSLPQNCPRYWVVNSDDCSNACNQRCPGCNLTVCSRQSCGSLQKSSLSSLQRKIAPSVPVCIFVHGSTVNRQGRFIDATKTAHWIASGCSNKPIQLIFFEWPSYSPLNPLTHLDILVFGRRATRHGAYLARLIGSLPRNQRVCLIGHSHGARMIGASLQMLAGGTAEGHGIPRSPYCGRIRAVLVGAALDHNWFNPSERFERALVRSECIVNIRNSKDLPLKFYKCRQLCSSDAMGFKGFTPSDRAKLGPLSKRAHDIEVQQLLGNSHAWFQFRKHPSIAHSIGPVVSFANDR